MRIIAAHHARFVRVAELGKMKLNPLNPKQGLHGLFNKAKVAILTGMVVAGALVGDPTASNA